VKLALISSVLALCAAVVPVSAQAVTEFYQLNIPRQTLDAALKDLAEQTGLQIARFSDTPDGSALVGPVTGKVSIAEALNSLLTPSGLTYKVVNERTIAILQRNAGLPPSKSASTHSANAANPAEIPEGVDIGQSQSNEELPQTTQAPSQTTESRSQTAAESHLEEVIVTGFRRSLEDAAQEKRRKTNFTDSIFAEDIGKFPDQNLAESLQRLPGIQIERDAAGEGTRVNIRGLGSQFAVLSMNGAQLQTASDNSIGFINDGRGSSLDLFPTELFRSLTVSKTPIASQIEGGIAGNVELRPVRPFDRMGFHVDYQLKGTYDEVSDKMSPRGGLFISDTWDGSFGQFGVLVGAAYAGKEYRSDTFNTVGFTTFSLGANCPPTQAGCNSLSFTGNAANPVYGYGGGASVPANVPAGTGFGLTDGTPLKVCGPGGTSGLSCDELSFVVMPRLARAETVAGERERTAGLVTIQWQPSDDLALNLDLIYAQTENNFAQHDLMLMLRSTSNNVPFDVQVNEKNILTHATFANAQLLSENRPFATDADFYNSTLGVNYQLTDRLKLAGSATYNDSYQRQTANTVLLRTPLGKGFAVTYDLEPGALTPRLSTNFDPSDPNLGWQWDTMRVQPHRRSVRQKDAQFRVEFGDPEFLISSGMQYTSFIRRIRTWDVSGCATDAVNGRCSATSTVNSEFPGARTVIPNSQLGNYMTSWPFGQIYANADFDVGLNNGWSIPDYGKITSVLNLDYFENDLDPATRVSTYNPRGIDEVTNALFVQLDGETDLFSKKIRYNAGVRGFRTEQEVSGIVTDPTVGRVIQFFDQTYTKYLPSFNVAADITDNIIFRLAGGRTMTRPTPGDLTPAFNLSLGGDTLTLGNPALRPYFSKQLDVGFEWYINPRNTLALNLWGKKIDGFTSIYRTTARFDTLGINFNNLLPITQDGLRTLGQGDENAALVNIDQRQNTPETITLTGLELTLLQPLDFVLNGLGFAANYTRIDQESEGAPPVAGSRASLGSAVTGLSPNTYNLSVYFERAAFSSRLSYNYRDAFVTFIGPQNNIEGNGVALKSEYLDASLSFGLPWFENTRVSFEAQNLLNQIQLTRIDGDPDLPYDARAPGRTFLLGLSGHF
jgi:TonB-dependent receptor